MSQKPDSDKEKQTNKWEELVEREAEEMVDEVAVPASDTAELEKKLNDAKEQYVRAQAEVSNIRMRMEQEVARARKFGAERLVSELIPILDSITRGLKDEHVAHNDVKGMQAGMEMTLSMLRNVLEKNGVTIVNPAVGDVFDPAMHEAMSMQKDPSHAHNTILQVLEQGYALNGRVVRAAMVIVAA